MRNLLQYETEQKAMVARDSFIGAKRKIEHA